MSDHDQNRTCLRCGECCRVIAIPTKGLLPDAMHYLKTRGLEVQDGCILVPHKCKHLVGHTSNGTCFTDYSCDLHGSPSQPRICRLYHGQKRIGMMPIFRPPGCNFLVKKCPYCGETLEADTEYPNDLLCGKCEKAFDRNFMEEIPWSP